MTQDTESPYIASVMVEGLEIDVVRCEYVHDESYMVFADEHPRIALLAFEDVTGDYYDDVTVNLPDQPIEDEDTEFFVKDTTARGALVSALVADEVIAPTGRTVAYGNFDSTAVEYRLINSAENGSENYTK